MTDQIDRPPRIPIKSTCIPHAILHIKGPFTQPPSHTIMSFSTKGPHPTTYNSTTEAVAATNGMYGLVRNACLHVHQCPHPLRFTLSHPQHGGHCAPRTRPRGSLAPRARLLPTLPLPRRMARLPLGPLPTSSPTIFRQLTTLPLAPFVGVVLCLTHKRVCNTARPPREGAINSTKWMM